MSDELEIIKAIVPNANAATLRGLVIKAFNKIQEQTKREAILVGALEFYANYDGNFEEGNYCREIPFKPGMGEDDCGKTARQALKQYKEKD